MDTIRMIKAALFNKEIELKKELDEADMSRVLTTLVKQRKEALNLSRRRVLKQLQTVQNPRHRQMLEAAISDLDAQLARMG